MNEAIDTEMRLSRLERTQTLMLDKLDSIERRLDDGLSYAQPMGSRAMGSAHTASADAAQEPRNGGRAGFLGGGLVTVASLVIVMIGVIWLADEFHIGRAIERLF